MIKAVTWECDYSNPEKISSFSSDGRFETITKYYYIKCYYYIEGNKKETNYKYFSHSDKEGPIDHLSYSYTDTKEEKTGKYIQSHHYKYFLWFDWDHDYSYSYQYYKYKREVMVLDNGKKIYGDWCYDSSYYK